MVPQLSTSLIAKGIITETIAVLFWVDTVCFGVPGVSDLVGGQPLIYYAGRYSR